LLRPLLQLPVEPAPVAPPEAVWRGVRAAARPATGPAALGRAACRGRNRGGRPPIWRCKPMNYLLMKSQPETFGIDALAARPKRTTHWDGVRNFQARNFMRDQMRVGDLAFFYHSNCDEPGIVGIVKIVKEGYPDDSAFDRKDKHYDAESDPNK